MTDYVVVPHKMSHFPIQRRFLGYSPLPGVGYFESEFPDYIVTVDGEPSTATIRVLLRVEGAPPGVDGYVVSQVTVSASGQWRVEGLDPSLKYDVVCRVPGYNDLIYTDLTPKVD